MLGHELRNPLAPILTALQLMRLRAGAALENERTVIERQTRHLVRLVDDLLDVSRIARGKIELRKERIHLADAVAKGIEMASPLLEERSHTLTVDVPREFTVDADPARLAQVVANLLTNAAKYTEAGGSVSVFAEQTASENRPERPRQPASASTLTCDRGCSTCSRRNARASNARRADSAWVSRSCGI